MIEAAEDAIVVQLNKALYVWKPYPPYHVSYTANGVSQSVSFADREQVETIYIVSKMLKEWLDEQPNKKKTRRNRKREENFMPCM